MGSTTSRFSAAGGGPLSDHYDPRKREVFLSETVHDNRSVTASAIAAHEVGHAIQHAKAYKPMQLRSAMFPVVAFSSNFWMILLVGGVLLNAIGLIQLALVLYAAAVLFHFVTLPVEFDASRRAGRSASRARARTAGAEQRESTRC